MRVFIILVLLAVTCNQVFPLSVECTASVISCGAQHTDIVTSTTCEQKAPFFACLRKECSTDDTIYKQQVELHKYESCGASAIIMGWTLPILMFSLVKYFSK